MRVSGTRHRGVEVRDYRMFLLDERGHILAREEYAAADDADSVAKARELFAARPHFAGFEVWDLGRVVHREERA
jgi:hypothetical protein